jgi:glycosyltransferase involved in cell wall biosynthesis
VVTAPSQPQQERKFGVNIAGHIRSEKGVGEGVRSTIRCLKSAGVPVTLNDFTDFSSLNTDTEFASSFSEANPYSINLIHANADCLLEFKQWKTEEYFKDYYNIGFWAWELSRFPQKWCAAFNPLNEVWAPSTFAVDSISRVSPVPVVVIPHALRKLTIAGNRDRASFGLPKDRFLFLFMFDFMSILQRKNPLGLIKAFRKAFKPRDRVTLVLKSSHADEYPSERRELEQAVKGSNVILLDQTLSREDTDALLNLCDCYVSLHRSEGFGLTMLEAMSLGKPVIATGYSGNVDFMTPLNSFLVNYRLVSLDKDYTPYPKDSVWADPDQDHAAELMRSVYRNKKMARDIGRQAQKDVTEKLSEAAVGAIIRERLTTLASMGKISMPDALPQTSERRSRKPNPEYEGLVGRLQKLIRSATSPGDTVLVISKGDEALVNLPERRGWHFPQRDDGVYAGYYPNDSAAAIGHLEVLRAKGGQFLLIPQTALWWLDHYKDFGQHLDKSYRKIKTNEDGVLYELSNRGGMKERIVVAQKRGKRKSHQRV